MCGTATKTNAGSTQQTGQGSTASTAGDSSSTSGSRVSNEGGGDWYVHTLLYQGLMTYSNTNIGSQTIGSGSS